MLGVALVLCLISISKGCDVETYYQGINIHRREEAEMLLFNLVNNATVIPYYATWYPLSELYINKDDPQLIDLVYSEIKYERTNQKRRPNINGWNREHLFPQSFGLSKVAKSDLFNLRPSDPDANNLRENLKFDFCEGLSCIMPACESCGSDTERGDRTIMPPERSRGSLARSVFYMLVRYPELKKSGFGNWLTLLQWHASFPVSNEERLINNRVCQEFQHNRNPFVDNPEWVYKILFPDFKSSKKGKKSRKRNRKSD